MRREKQEGRNEDREKLFMLARFQIKFVTSMVAVRLAEYPSSRYERLGRGFEGAAGRWSRRARRRVQRDRQV